MEAGVGEAVEPWVKRLSRKFEDLSLGPSTHGKAGFGACNPPVGEETGKSLKLAA